MTSSFEYLHEDEEGTKLFDLTYDFTPSQREVRYDSNGDGHPEWPAEVDIFKAVCVELNRVSLPQDDFAGVQLGKQFLMYLDKNQDILHKIEEKIIDEREDWQ